MLYQLSYIPTNVKSRGKEERSTNSAQTVIKYNPAGKLAAGVLGPQEAVACGGRNRGGTNAPFPRPSLRLRTTFHSRERGVWSRREPRGAPALLPLLSVGRTGKTAFLPPQATASCGPITQSFVAGKGTRRYEQRSVRSTLASDLPANKM